MNAVATEEKKEQTGVSPKTNEEVNLLESIEKKERSLEDMKGQLLKLTAEFRNEQDELNQQIYNQGKDTFSDINVEQLLTDGEIEHTAHIGKVKFILKTLTKRESLEIDKLSKAYINEADSFYRSGVQTDILSYVLIEYNGNKPPPGKDEKDNFQMARRSVQSLSDDVVNIIWSVYNRMTRWIKAALEIDLKN